LALKRTIKQETSFEWNDYSMFENSPSLNFLFYLFAVTLVDEKSEIQKSGQNFPLWTRKAPLLLQLSWHKFIKGHYSKLFLSELL
jgi:hypothetical protein